MTRPEIVTVLLLWCIAMTGLAATAQGDGESGAIKTDYGFLLVWNAPDNHYTLEIRGRNVRQVSTQKVQFSVDGMFLQVVTAPTSNFLPTEDRKAKDDKAILEAHRDWEVKFMEDDYKETLKLESTLRKLSNGKDALAWGITVPESAHTNVKKQLSLTLLKGNFVLMLGGIVTDTITEGASQQLLLNTAETLQTSDRPIDLRKLQEAIRKEASLPMADPVDNSKATIKGRIFRSDTNQPIPNAEIVLMDENKSAKQVSRIEALTDAKGNYTLDRVPAGSYTVSIRARYKTPEDVPCKLLLGKTSDKNSNVIVIGDADGVVEQVFIKGFEVKMGKMMSKDFDFACTSLFGN